MFPLVEQYNERTRSAAAFCAEHGVSYGRLNYWRRKYRHGTAATDSRGFVEIGSAALREAAQEEIAYPHERRALFTSSHTPYLSGRNTRDIPTAMPARVDQN